MIVVFYLVFAFVILAIYHAMKTFNYRRILNKIPSPTDGPPLFGNLYKRLSNPDEAFDLLRKYAVENYPIYRMSSMFGVSVAFLHPDDVEQVLTGSKHLEKSTVYNIVHDWLGTGLLTSSGAKWHARRKLLTPAVHFGILKRFVDVFNREAEKLVARLNGGRKEIIDITPFIAQFTVNAITGYFVNSSMPQINVRIVETAMGFSKIEENWQIHYREAVSKLGQIYMERHENIGFYWKTIYQFSKLADREREQIAILHGFSNRIIAERQNEGSYTKHRFLDILLKAKQDGADIDNEGIREEVDTFMFAGQDTTAMTVTYILFTLANHQDIQSRVYEEIIEVVPDRQHPTYVELQRLKYTEMCIKECLRLYPVVPFIARVAGETFVSRTGYEIPKGTVLHLPIFDIHRNPEYFPQPNRFDPDRFLPANSRHRHPFVFIPFSAGPRNCLGQKYALLKIKSALCALLCRFIFESADCELQFRPDLILRPRSDIQIKVTPR